MPIRLGYLPNKHTISGLDILLSNVRSYDMHEPKITYVDKKEKYLLSQNFTLLVSSTTYKTNLGKLYEDFCCLTTHVNASRTNKMFHYSPRSSINRILDGVGRPHTAQTPDHGRTKNLTLPN